MVRETKLKITPAKGRPMLYWVGKKPLDYVKGYPAQLSEIFDPLKTGLNYDYQGLFKNITRSIAEQYKWEVK